MALKPTRYDPVSGDDVIWQDGGLAGQLLRGEVFPAVAAVITGTLSVSEDGADGFVADGSVSAGVQTVTGTLAVTESGADSFAGSGFRAVTGSASATESGSDAMAASGLRAVTGSAAVTESGDDAFAGSGVRAVVGAASTAEAGDDTLAAGGSVSTPSATITGGIAVVESGADTIAASGVRGVQGDAAASEQGSDLLEAAGEIRVPITGSLTVSEAGADLALADGALNVTVQINLRQALLLRQLHQIHGLAEPLLVSATAREAGDLRQSIVESAGEVTVQTIAGSDTFAGDVGVMIEELAALHGLTAPLVVTPTSRVVGSITQLLQASGSQTLVARQ